MKIVAHDFREKAYQVAETIAKFSGGSVVISSLTIVLCSVILQVFPDVKLVLYAAAFATLALVAHLPLYLPAQAIAKATSKKRGKSPGFLVEKKTLAKASAKVLSMAVCSFLRHAHNNARARRNTSAPRPVFAHASGGDGSRYDGGENSEPDPDSDLSEPSCPFTVTPFQKSDQKLNSSILLRHALYASCYWHLSCRNHPTKGVPA